jgi:hypothetical protein
MRLFVNLWLFMDVERIERSASLLRGLPDTSHHALLAGRTKLRPAFIQAEQPVFHKCRLNKENK